MGIKKKIDHRRVREGRYQLLTTTFMFNMECDHEATRGAAQSEFKNTYRYLW